MSYCLDCLPWIRNDTTKFDYFFPTKIVALPSNYPYFNMTGRLVRKETPLSLWAGLTYFDHQRAGIRKMLALERTGTEYPEFESEPKGRVYGGLQCDDMGLGKTIQILATMKTNPKPKPC